VLYREYDVVKAALRWINADRQSRSCQVGHVLGRCVNFSRLTSDELVHLSNSEPYVLDSELIRDAIYKANWSVRYTHEHFPPVSLFLSGITVTPLRYFPNVAKRSI